MKNNKLEDKLKESKLGGGQKRIDAQHKKGKLTSRERLELLLDSNSFEEIGGFITHRSTNFGLEKTKFLKGYGIENKNNDIDRKIESWSLMNSYTELIWAMYLKKLSKGLIKEKYLESLMTNIKQQTL